MSRLHNYDAVKKLSTSIVQQVGERKGGYVRIIKAGYRYGDCAPVAYVELVDRKIDADSGVENQIKE